MTRLVRIGGGLAVCGVAALSVSLVGGAGAQPAPAFAGFSSSASAMPVQVEVFDPTIPLPVTPQAEVELGLSRAVADSGSGRAKATFVWPGDLAGEGAGALLGALGAPPQVSAVQYPVQVNAGHPGDQTEQANEPAPGSLNRASSRPGRTAASVGYSSTCAAGVGSSSTTPATHDPGAPVLPGAPLPAGVVPNPTGYGQVTPTAGDAADACQIPAPLSAVVSLGGYQSNSVLTNTAGQVNANATAKLADVVIAGGLLRISGVTAGSAVQSDGRTPTTTGSVSHGTLTLAGRRFDVGPDGVETGSPVAIPGLPDQADAALEALGISVTAPKPVVTRNRELLTRRTEALIVTIDATVLRSKLNALPLAAIAELIDGLPDALAQLRTLGGVLQLSPKFVIHLGRTTSTVQTVQGVPLPGNGTAPSASGSPGSTPAAPAGGGSSGSGAGTGPGPTTDPGVASGDSTPLDPGSGTPTTTSGDAPASQPDLTSALSDGLPEVLSLPGALLIAGLGAAGFLGTRVRRIGALALGDVSSCQHGLASGLPDLRKA